jgi:LysM repeat protein
MFRSSTRFIPLILICALLLAVFPTAAQEQTTHTVQRGETLYRIALRYGVSMDSIAQANSLTNLSRILAGQQLIIPNFDASGEVVENPLVAGTPVYHTIQPGETLARIAAQYGMTLNQLIQLNNITNPDLIYRGQQLAVWSTTDADPTLDDPAAPQITLTEAPAAEAVSAPPAAAESTYVVQRGEHLSQIARRFGLTWTQLAQANNIVNPDQIYAGQTLVIPAGGVVTDAGTFAVSAPLIEPASPTIFVGRQIVVDLSDQMVYAFENGQLIRSVLVSTGLPATPTVQGDYNVYVKYGAQTMSGPGYYLPDVPYVMYFYQGYALHGTYWHSNFGNPMSHGCVNLPTPEAEWLFTNFVEVGTPVHVKF